jgi:hypothetical protein
MSASDQPPKSQALDALVAEAKEHFDVGPKDVDWSRLEAKLMTAIEEERPARAARWKRDSVLRACGIALASAAAIAVFVHKERENEREHASVSAAKSTPEMARGTLGEHASSLRSIEGSGVARVNEHAVVPGHGLRPGDVIDVAGARAVFERGHKVTWLIEGRDGHAGQAGAARASVKAAEESLVLGLDDGAIEAQVTPVPQGEAFAVDIATDHSLVRVAVHGTHLRVTRTGDRVLVDLTEGVVSIGVPPRVGVTYGTLVTAPAHVELDATDLRTLRVEHGAGAIRAAIPLGPRETASAAQPEAPALTAPLVPTAVANHGAIPRPADAVVAKHEPAKSKTPPREVIAAAVRECAAARSRSGDDIHVTVTVTSDLHLNVSSTGEVVSAQFSPPLLPEIQTCAASVIYKTKLDETGAVIVPIEFSF